MPLPKGTLLWLVWVCTSDQYGKEALAGVYDSFITADVAEKNIHGYQVRTEAVWLNEELRWKR